MAKKNKNKDTKVRYMRASLIWQNISDFLWGVAVGINIALLYNMPAEERSVIYIVSTVGLFVCCMAIAVLRACIATATLGDIARRPALPPVPESNFNSKSKSSTPTTTDTPSESTPAPLTPEN